MVREPSPGCGFCQAGTAQAYLVIRNLSPVPDELIAVRAPGASHDTFIGGVRGRPGRAAGLTIPAEGTLTFSLATSGLLINRPVPFTLVFRHAGRATIDVTVTAT